MTPAALTLLASVGANAKGDQPDGQPFLVRKGEAHEGPPLVVQGDPEASEQKFKASTATRRIR